MIKKIATFLVSLTCVLFVLALILYVLPKNLQVIFCQSQNTEKAQYELYIGGKKKVVTSSDSFIKRSIDDNTCLSTDTSYSRFLIKDNYLPITLKRVSAKETLTVDKEISLNWAACDGTDKEFAVANIEYIATPQAKLKVSQRMCRE